jgi:hypothetical protein
MAIPHTYAEWLPLLDRFRAGDDSVLDSLKEGSIEWTNIVAERWTRQVVDCFSSRLQALSTQLQKALDRARGDYFAVANALLMARRGLTPLRVFVNIPGFPSDIQTHLASELTRWTTETQNSLEQHAKDVRHDQGRLLKTIRDNNLTTVFEGSIGGAGNQEPESTTPTIRGRRIILS